MQEARIGAIELANFFLIDQSLREVGGHHHDYVRCVASAASQSGYLTTIGTNCQLRHDQALQSHGKLRKVFRETTYNGDSYLSGLRHLTRTTSDYLPEKKHGRAPYRLRDFLSPMKFLRVCRNSRHHARRKKNIRNFAMDCDRFFGDMIMSEHDHAFFATVNELEFMGLAAFLANHPRTIQVNWHLQFHFNLFDGRTPEYHEQQNVAAAIQNCFDAALTRIPYHKLNFYTTSETLADQFNRLNVGNFKVLAYPVRPELFENLEEKQESNSENFKDRPLKITCPGEVRREKKMVQYLQPLVDQIWENQIQSGNVQIVVQRPVRKWPAREKIELKPPVVGGEALPEPDHEWVKYFSHPLSDLEYLELIQSTDCGLLFYDSRAYFSRRAGVLSELLSCGKPVIVPAGSWLADQISEPNFRYVDSLCNVRNRRRTLMLEDLTWNKHNVPSPGGVLTFDQTGHPFELQFELQPGETGFVLEYDWHWPQDQGVYCRFELLDDSGEVENHQIIGHRINGMSPVGYFETDQKSVRLRMANAFHDSSASIRQISIHTLTVDASQTPAGSVGVIASGEEDIPRAIDEIVAHYDHYRSTAKMFSKTWCRQHEPQQTLSSLVTPGESFRPAA